MYVVSTLIATHIFYNSFTFLQNFLHLSANTLISLRLKNNNLKTFIYIIFLNKYLNNFIYIICVSILQVIYSYSLYRKPFDNRY